MVVSNVLSNILGYLLLSVAIQLEDSQEQLGGLNDITGNIEEISSLEVSISTVFVEDLNSDVQGNDTVRLNITFLD